MKHAFMIMAHTNFDLLIRLIKKLDCKDHVIYVHIDKKSDLKKEVIMQIKAAVKNASVHMVQRSSVNWGGFSVINCELVLLKEAIKSKADYYHYLSGMDYPIKSMTYFHEFFEKNAGKEFINLTPGEFSKDNEFRVKYYHPLQELANRNRKNPLFWLEKSLILLQKIIRVDRMKQYKGIEFRGGSEWCSFSYEFAAYLLKKEEFIRKAFAQTYCCDEFFVQTVFYNSPFLKRQYVGNDYEQCMREIDWKRGNPYTFDVRDYDMLMASNCLFCRKVGTGTDEQKALLEKLDQL